MRIVFIGASKFGLRCLEKVMTLPECEVAGILTNPETFSISYRPEGVKNVLHVDFRPLAKKHGIPVFVMKGKMSYPLLVKTIQKWEPDFILVVGWYHMVPKSIREIAFTAGLHASLLPDYSGGAPLVWAIINGETETGITFFQFSDAVDNGHIIGQAKEMISLSDTIFTLYSRIEDKGLQLLKIHLPEIARGEAVFTEQDESKRRIFPQRGPEDGKIEWNQPAKNIYNFIRAQTKPYPGAFTTYKGKKLIIWSSGLTGCPRYSEVAGEVLTINDDSETITVSCLESSEQEILLYQVEEKGYGRQESAGEYARRKRMGGGAILGN